MAVLARAINDSKRMAHRFVMWLRLRYGPAWFPGTSLAIDIQASNDSKTKSANVYVVQRFGLFAVHAHIATRIPPGQMVRWAAMPHSQIVGPLAIVSPSHVTFDLVGRNVQNKLVMITKRSRSKPLTLNLDRP